MIWLTLAAALAGPPCETRFEPLEGALSVAWISPVRERVGARARVEVVRTADLREWLGDHPDADVARVLQALGLRRSPDPSRRLWKVTVFEVAPADLCRPIAQVDAGWEVDGLPGCGRARRHARCGYTVDRADSARGLDVYRVAWRDAAARGFCVLPAERFVAEGAR